MLPVLFLSCGYPQPRSPEDKRRAEADGWIGVYAQDIDEEMRDYMKLDSQRGVLVSDIIADSPAEEAGLRQEDIILRFDDKSIKNVSDLTEAVQGKRAGQKVRIEVVRDHEKRRHTIIVRERQVNDVGSREHEAYRVPTPDHGLAGHRAWLGIRMARINADLAHYFDVEEDEGVLILSIVKDSPAEKAGLRSGDIIHGIEDERVYLPIDVHKKLESCRPGDTIRIEFTRRGKRDRVDAQLSGLRRSLRFRSGSSPFLQGHEALNELTGQWPGRTGCRRGNGSAQIPLRALSQSLEHAVQHLGDELRQELNRLEGNSYTGLESTLSALLFSRLGRQSR